MSRLGMVEESGKEDRAVNRCAQALQIVESRVGIGGLTQLPEESGEGRGKKLGLPRRGGQAVKVGEGAPRV